MENFSDIASKRLAKEIKKAGGKEVFFVGSFSAEDAAVDAIKVFARGNNNSVPAIVDAANRGDVVIHNHPGGDLTPSDADIHMASVFGNKGVGFFIINNEATEVYVVVEPFSEIPLTPIDTDELSEILAPSGAISASLGSEYEKREQQVEMMERVANSFNEGTISLIEAGTGTGKTLAYLIPSVYWALQNGTRVVISTNTINLQEQLVQKDIPLLKRSLPDKVFKTSLVKGMGNYVCLLRVGNVGDGMLELFEDEEVDTLTDIVDWSKTTQDGSLSDLSFTPPRDVWDKVRAETESCLRVRCPHYSDCFFFKARRDMASSEILIANHHLVFSDLAIKGGCDEGDFGILPPYEHIIFDEAHHIEDAATSHFGGSVRRFTLLRLLRRIRRVDRRGKSKGLVYYLAELTAKLEKHMRKGVLNTVLGMLEGTLVPRVDEAEEHTARAFDELYKLGAEASKMRKEFGPEFNIRITEAQRAMDLWDGVEEKFRKLCTKYVALEQDLKALIDLFTDYESETDVAKVMVEFKGVANKIHFYTELMLTFFSQVEDGYVRWIEGRPGKGDTLSGLGISPLDVSRELNERLYSRARSIVLTSATMAMDGSFEFLRSGVGLGELKGSDPVGGEGGSRPPVEEALLPAPFNYKEQVLLAVPTDMPEPGTDLFPGAVATMVGEAVKISDGNALILFTSYSLLEKVYNSLYEELSMKGFLTLRQGAKPRSLLLKEFSVEDRSVLFATDSFWEGVDVRGESLRLVVIVRLPFKVPTDPVIEARVESIEQAGRNSFLEYTVPQAVLKFKQGFGRLIRSRTDKGAVLVLDRRVVSKHYGRYFLKSLPNCEFISAPGNEINLRLKSFFDSLFDSLDD